MKSRLLTACLLIWTVAGCRSGGSLAERAMLPDVGSASAQTGNHLSVRLPQAAGPVQPASYDQPASETEPPKLNAPYAPAPATLPKTGGPLPDRLTLEQLLQVAMTNNPTLAEAAARVEAARGRWVQVGLWPNPRVGYAGEEIGDEGTAGKQGGFIGQTIVTGGKLRLDRQTVEWQIRRAERELEAQRLRVMTDTRLAFYDVLIAQQRRTLAQDLVRISNRAVDAAEALFRGEEVSEADPLRARVEAAQARILLEDAENQYLEAWQTLAAVIGLPQLQPRTLTGRLEPAELQLTWEQSLQQIIAQSPELAAMLADVEAARWAVARAQAEVIPDVETEFTLQQNNASGDTITGVRVEIPVPVFDRNQGGIRQAEAELVAAQRAMNRLQLDLQIRLASAFQRYSSARQRVESYSRKGGILENARRTLDLIAAGYRAEEFGVLDLLGAQRTYFQTNLDYLESLRQFWSAATEIQGLLLKDSLQ